MYARHFDSTVLMGGKPDRFRPKPKMHIIVLSSSRSLS